MDNSQDTNEVSPRSAEEIFEDLRTLAWTDGALHCLSHLIYRDWLITIDTQEKRITDDPEHRWSTSKLNKNELMLLLGLIVQSPSPSTYDRLPSDLNFVNGADRLLREFHDRVILDARGEFPAGPAALNLIAREAIYYGPECLYLHQLEHFSRHRYQKDGDWLLANIGVSIRPILAIARYIADRTTKQMTAVSFVKDSAARDPGLLTSSLCIPKGALMKRFGAKASAFLQRFSTSSHNTNSGFDNPFAINQVNIAPVIDLGDYVYAPNIYRLFESIYESPFYWMMADSAYRNTAAEHRGNFLENSVAHLFRTVFGAEHVFENVKIYRTRRDIGSEADVLVVYGEFVIIVQAKSKRVTQKARAGDPEALKTDFEGAIQSPYRQAYHCAELIENGAEAVTKAGKTLTFTRPTRVFPVVIQSDGFPASTFLSSNLLQRSNRIAPVIWDIGVLDCVVRMLPTPVDLLFYLKARSDAFDSITSDSEYNFVGFHLQHKLVLPSDVDVMMIDRDYAAVVDDYMIARDLKLEPKRPVGILERVKIPIVSDLLHSLKAAPPALASVVVELYEMSSAALEDISKQIVVLRDDVRSGKTMKAFSVLTASGGLTYLVCRQLDQKMQAVAEAIGAKHKYDNKRDRWYVVIDSLQTLHPVDGLLPILGSWKEDPDLAANSKRVAELFGSRTSMTRVLGDKAPSDNDS